MFKHTIDTVSSIAQYTVKAIRSGVREAMEHIRQTWGAHRTAMEANNAYRQAFYTGVSALLTAQSLRNVGMAVVGLLLSLYVAIFGPIRPTWPTRPINHWEDEEPLNGW